MRGECSKGLKAADCSAAAHLSFSVTFAQSRYIPQKLLPRRKNMSLVKNNKHLLLPLKPASQWIERAD